MSDFADVERFAREHAACGGLTPSAMPRPGGGGYLLTLTCVCGASFDRWVSPEEARQPLPIPARAPQAPVAPAASAPRLPAAPGSRAPASARPKPRPSEELEALVREALAAEEAAATQAPAAPSPAAPPAAPDSPGPEAARPAARARPAPERLNLDTTIRSALQQQAEMALPPPRPRRGSRGRAVWLALFMIVGLGAAGVIYVTGGPGGPVAPGPSGSPAPRAGDPHRAALESVAKSLRDLHSVATSTTSVSVYSTRVTAAKTEAERYLAASAPGANRTRVREALDIHLLAVSAWRAKSLDQKDAWEAVGLDPSIDLCPPLRLVADFAVQPENVSRAQSRGAAVASALPLLWECANERIAALEQTLANR
jgi:hypothetical protein